MDRSGLSIARSLRHASRDELRDRIVGGFPVDPAAIEGWAYRGTSVGLPAAVERLTWKTFQKTFWREPRSGRLVGWNVRLEQDGIDAPSRPALRRGRPITEWHYEVVEPRHVQTPPGFDRGLIIDYSLGPNRRFEPVRLGKDPLVALSPDDYDELIGVTYLVVAGRCIETPTYFLLERDHPIDFVPSVYGRAAGSPLDEHEPLGAATRLRGFERQWAEALFEALLPGDEASRLPAFHEIDRVRFWRCIARAPAPTFGLGLRAMVYALTFVPIGSTGPRRPFHRLDPAERQRRMAAMAGDERFVVRQLVSTLKTLACLAYFDDPLVRERLGADPPGSRSAAAGPLVDGEEVPVGAQGPHERGPFGEANIASSMCDGEERPS